MKKYGLRNGWWLIIEKIEDLTNPNIGKKSAEAVFAKGLVYFINQAGGYHYGKIEEMFEIKQSVNFPI